MRPTLIQPTLRAGLLALSVTLLAGCTIAKPRTDDPWEHFNRKMYAFNDVADKAKVIWLNYPNNPTGAVADFEFFERAVAWAKG